MAGEFFPEPVVTQTHLGFTWPGGEGQDFSDTSWPTCGVDQSVPNSAVTEVGVAIINNQGRGLNQRWVPFRSVGELRNSQLPDRLKIPGDLQESFQARLKRIPIFGFYQVGQLFFRQQNKVFDGKVGHEIYSL
ncbi:MAG: hypothetical protein HQK56_03425 [Deltaproteobacteria bacterium]|nr:hypothetical protein [Deltaproteobacteria bacterium]